MRMPGQEHAHHSRQELQTLQADKMHFLEHWTTEQTHLVVTAIKAGIVAELCARDTRIYGIPEDNRRGAWQERKVRVGNSEVNKGRC